jgi:hypothetical protein
MIKLGGCGEGRNNADRLMGTQKSETRKTHHHFPVALRDAGLALEAARSMPNRSGAMKNRNLAGERDFSG